jgi:hypothetical protein
MEYKIKGTLKNLTGEMCLSDVLEVFSKQVVAAMNNPILLNKNQTKDVIVIIKTRDRK